MTAIERIALKRKRSEFQSFFIDSRLRNQLQYAADDWIPKNVFTVQ